MFLNIGAPKIINFPFGTNGKLMFFDVPILKHFKVTYVFVTLSVVWKKFIEVVFRLIESWPTT